MTTAEIIDSTPLRRIVSELGTSLVEVITDRRAGDVLASGVLIHDPSAPLPPMSGEIVLAIGVSDEEALERLMARMTGNPAAVVVSRPFAPTRRLQDKAADRAMAVLALRDGVTWLQLSSTLLFAFSESRSGGGASLVLGEEPLNELFAAVNAISSYVGSPVTIEDTNSRVLAFSARQDETDPQRQETVLSSRVPDVYTARMKERGLFQRVYEADGPVYIDRAELEFEISRTAMAVRVGDDVLGAVWLASDERVTPEQEKYLRESSKVVALHILRHRAKARRAQEARSELLDTVFRGGSAGDHAAGRLGVKQRRQRVLAIEVARAYGPAEAGQRHADLQRLSDLVDTHVHAHAQVLPSARLGDAVYVVLPETQGDPRAATFAAELMRSVGLLLPARGGLGRAVTSVRELHLSRTDAERALRVLRAENRAEVRGIEEVRPIALLHEIVDREAELLVPDYPPLVRLLKYDEANDSGLAPTLRVWLEELGDTNRTAERLHLHPNTCRYRLKRISEVSEIDLGSPDERFLLMLTFWMQTQRRRREKEVTGGDQEP